VNVTVCLQLAHFGEDLVVGVDQLDPHFVRAGRQPSYVDC
jgi:hypothetical protein